MAAINIILTRFLSLPIGDTIRIGFGSVPLILTGIILGPVPALCVALVGDFIGCVFFSAYSWFAPLVLSPMFIAAWAGMFRKQLLQGKYWQIMLICLSSAVIASVFYGTYCLTILTGNGFLPLLISRTPVQLLTAVANSLIVYLLLKSPIVNILRFDTDLT